MVIKKFNDKAKMEFIRRGATVYYNQQYITFYTPPTSFCNSSCYTMCSVVKWQMPLTSNQM